MTTVGEEIDIWIKSFESGDEIHRDVLVAINILEKFKQDKIREYVKTRGY